MTRQRSNTGRPKRNSRNSGAPLRNTLAQQSLAKLTQLVDAEETQIRGRSPQIADVPRLLIARHKVYTFVKTAFSTTITPSTTLDVFGASNFSLSSTSDSASFQSLFDQWRIMQVTQEFIPLTTGPYAGPLYTVLDYDDSSPSTTITQLYEYDTLEITQAGQMVSRTLVPKPAMAVYSGAFTSFAQPSGSPWIDVASPSVQYYGIKWAVPALTGGTTTGTYQVISTITYQFRHGR